MLSDRRRRQRSQSMVEFALVAPLLLLMLFGIVDFGRVIYAYITLNQAVNEGARVAIRASPVLPSNSDVETAVRSHAVDVTLANPCPNGPITSTAPPANQGWIYITEKDPPSTRESLTDLHNQAVASGQGFGNAPGGQMWGTATSLGYPANCSDSLPAYNHAQLQVTIHYNFVPFTPLLRQATQSSIILKAAAVYRVEY